MYEIMSTVAIISSAFVYVIFRLLAIIERQANYIMAVKDEHALAISQIPQKRAEQNIPKSSELDTIAKANLSQSILLNGEISPEQEEELGLAS